MSITSLVLAFAGALAAKVRPAPPAHRLEEVIIERDAARARCDRWEARFELLERDNEALRTALEHELQRRNVEANPLRVYYQGGQQAQQARQAQLAQMNCWSQAQSALAMVQNFDCNCVPARHDMFGLGHSSS